LFYKGMDEEGRVGKFRMSGIIRIQPA